MNCAIMVVHRENLLCENYNFKGERSLKHNINHDFKEEHKEKTVRVAVKKR